jgi:hypothetical protein
MFSLQSHVFFLDNLELFMFCCYCDLSTEEIFSDAISLSEIIVIELWDCRC